MRTLAILTLALLSSHAALAQVELRVHAADNLADALEPWPLLYVLNQHDVPIEFEIVGASPHTSRRAPDGSWETGVIQKSQPANFQLPPGWGRTFPLWHRKIRVESADALVVLRYQLVHEDGRREAAEATVPLHPKLGNARPDDWVDGAPPGEVVLLGLTGRGVDEDHPVFPPASDVARDLLPQIEACVAQAQQELPWLRGEFTVTVFRFPGADQAGVSPVTWMLGRGPVDDCLQQLEAPAGLMGEVGLKLAVTRSIGGGAADRTEPLEEEIDRGHDLPPKGFERGQ
jgi:hypothetical protein